MSRRFVPMRLRLLPTLKVGRMADDEIVVIGADELVNAELDTHTGTYYFEHEGATYYWPPLD